MIAAVKIHGKKNRVEIWEFKRVPANSPGSGWIISNRKFVSKRLLVTDVHASKIDATLPII